MVRYLGRSILFLCTMLLIIGCQSHYKQDADPSSNKAQSSQQNAKKQNSKTELSSGKQPDQKKREHQLIKNYKKGLPGQLPDTSTQYTLTIDTTEGYASLWKPDQYIIALFNRTKNLEQPYRIIKATTNDHLLTFSEIPSASKEHMDVFGIGGKKPNYNMNAPVEIYTNKILKKHHHVDFVMGHAMTDGHFITELDGKKLKRGKAMNLGGYWFTLNTGKWYRLMEYGTHGNAHLVFKFKMDLVK